MAWGTFEALETAGFVGKGVPKEREKGEEKGRTQTKHRIIKHAPSLLICASDWPLEMIMIPTLKSSWTDCSPLTRCRQSVP